MSVIKDKVDEQDYNSTSNEVPQKMSRLKILISIGATLALSTLLLGSMASAHEFRASTNPNVPKTETIDNTLFIAGNSVNVDGDVNGDVFCAGQTINISGRVSGDVICGGQTIHISGTVEGDVRLAGQSVTISSAVGGNATIAGQNFTLESSGKIDGDLTIGSNNAVIYGPVTRDVAAGGVQLTIGSEIGRNIKGSFERLELTQTANVKGYIDFTSKNDISRASGAQVGGTITKHQPKETGTPKRGAVFGLGAMWFLYWFLAMLTVALAFALLFPGLLQNITDRAMPTPWKSLLTGLIAAVVVPVTLIVLAITLVGLPLALILGLLWLLIGLSSTPVTAYYIGRRVLKTGRNAIMIMLVGASILIVLYFVPFIGVIALVLSTWLGEGMILRELMRRTPRPVHVIDHPRNTKKTKVTSKS